MIILKQIVTGHDLGQAHSERGWCLFCKCVCWCNKCSILKSIIFLFKSSWICRQILCIRMYSEMLKVTVFWDVMLYSLVDIYQHVRGTCCRYLKTWRWGLFFLPVLSYFLLDVGIFMEENGDSNFEIGSIYQTT